MKGCVFVMKRFLSLLFVILLLCTCGGCNEAPLPNQNGEDVAGTPTYEYGTFFTEDGILQNTAITASVESQDLVAPVKELKYVLHDNSDYWVNDLVDKEPYAEWNIDARDVLEVYQDGTWQKVALCGGGASEKYRFQPMGDPLERKDYSLKMIFYPSEPGRPEVFHYDWLTPGCYRLRVTYWILTDDENAYIPEEQLEAVAYFTVVAPTE